MEIRQKPQERTQGAGVGLGRTQGKEPQGGGFQVEKPSRGPGWAPPASLEPATRSLPSGTKATRDLGLGGGRRVGVEEPVLSHVCASTCGRETSPLPGQLRICLLQTCVSPQGLQEGALCV